MLCSILSVALSVIPPSQAPKITGQYVEARTCDVFTGACFANADTNIVGKHAVLAWKIEKGTVGSAKLDGLSVVAVVAGQETLGLRLHTTPRSMLLVDSKATSQQRDALVAFAKQQAGNLLDNVIAVRSAPISVEACPCTNNSCAKVTAADVVKIETRCLNKNHDRGCGNDCDYFPPLIKGAQVRAAMAVENTFSGKEFQETWNDPERRGAFVGTFAVR